MSTFEATQSVVFYYGSLSRLTYTPMSSVFFRITGPQASQATAYLTIRLERGIPSDSGKGSFACRRAEEGIIWNPRCPNLFVVLYLHL